MNSYITTFLTAALIILGTLFLGPGCRARPDTARLWSVGIGTSGTGSPVYAASVKPIASAGVPQREEAGVNMAFACSDGDFSILVYWGTSIGTEDQLIAYLVGEEGAPGLRIWTTLAESNATYLGGAEAREFFRHVDQSPDKRVVLTTLEEKILGFDLALFNEATRDIRRHCNL